MYHPASSDPAAARAGFPRPPDLSDCPRIVGEESTYGDRPAYSWCPQCDSFNAEDIARFRVQAVERGAFFGSRFCPEHAAALLAAGRRHRALRATAEAQMQMQMQAQEEA